jgi:LysM repeat protein
MRRIKMNKKTIGLLVAVLMVAALFTACARPATTSPTASVIEETSTSGEIPFPVATQPQIMADILKQTQTAMALSTKDTSFPSASTSTPSFSFETPTPSTTLAVGGEATSTSAILSTSIPSTLATSTPMVLATAAPTKISYPTPTPGRPATYTIQAGEYLWCLARRFDVGVGDLLSMNGMNANSQPYEGTVIKIPQSGTFGAGRARNAHPAIYTVRAGDTIGGIACWYGDADPNTIFAANGLPANSIITVGQVLQIP